MNGELICSLTQAQRDGDRFAESKSIIELTRNIKDTRCNSKNKPVEHRFIDKVVFGINGANGCWYWFGAKHKLGYGLMNALGESKAHRISWRVYRGDIPQGMSVLHKCDVRNCVNPDHLFIGDQFDNMRDMVEKGRTNNKRRPGDLNPRSKLTNKQVHDIRNEFSLGGILQIELAKRYGVSPMAISRIIRKESYNV